MRDEALREFLSASRFAAEGIVVTDLDGTAVHEFEGRIAIPHAVSHGLKALNDAGRPVVLNSLRFPLNVIRTFGREWYSITNAPLPLVSLNGGLTGYLTVNAADEIVFEEIEAFPLSPAEIDEVLVGVRGLIEGGINDLVLFHYPRDWTRGEIIWTPAPEKVEPLAAKYLSASRVVSTGVEELGAELKQAEACMLLLLVDAPEDRLMAYQHSKRSNFVTRKGIDKLTGLQSLAARLQWDLGHAVGAGDTPMDVFLGGVGLAVQVGRMDLEFKGLHQTVKVGDSLELGAMLFRLAELQNEARG